MLSLQTRALIFPTCHTLTRLCENSEDATGLSVEVHNCCTTMAGDSTRCHGLAVRLIWLLVKRYGCSAFSSQREPPQGKPVACFAQPLRPGVAATVNLQRDNPWHPGVFAQSHEVGMWQYEAINSEFGPALEILSRIEQPAHSEITRASRLSLAYSTFSRVTLAGTEIGR
jgi:hypothetical protein